MIESFKLPNITPETLTGSIVSFNDEYGGLPLKSCTSLISGYQEGSGTPSPDNVRPLHAWSGANLTACGTNLFDDVYFAENGFIKQNDGSWYIVNNATPSHMFWKNKSHYDGLIFISYKYKYEYSNYSAGLRLKIYYTDGTSETVYSQVKTEFTVALKSSAQNKTVDYLAWDYGSSANSSYILNLSVSIEPVDYEPYNDNTYTFTFGQSIYQGYIDWKRGVVVGNVAVVDLGSLDYAQGDTGRVDVAKNLIESYTGLLPKKTTDLFLISSCFSAENNTLASTNSFIRFYTDVLATNFKNTFAGQTIAFELATPIEIPLGGINLLTQQGVNNIFCNTGDTTLEWLKVN